jgi:hypothetical protein
MNTETTLLFKETSKRYKFSYSNVLDHICQITLKFDEVLMNAIYDDGLALTLDLIYKIPGKEKVSKRLTVSKENIAANSWVERIYAGEFLREVTVFSSNYIKENSEIKFSINELKNDFEKTKINEEQLLHYILTDNWFMFLESVRKLSADDLKSFISKHLNHIQEINGPSSELIEYILAKQIIEFWGTGAIEIDQVDLAAEAYASGYDFIKKNNLLVIENYEKLDWAILNTQLSDRSEQVTREYGKLKEKINKHLKDDKVWKKVLERLNDFTVDAELIYNAYADVIDNLVNSNSIKNLDVVYQDWTLMQDNDARQQAKIVIQSTLPFGPAGFKTELLFLLEKNPVTYQQEFTLTVSDSNTEILSSEKQKHSKAIYSAKTREDLQAIHQEGSKGIEKELYNIIRDCISGSIIYRNFDFQAIKQD